MCCEIGLLVAQATLTRNAKFLALQLTCSAINLQKRAKNLKHCLITVKWHFDFDFYTCYKAVFFFVFINNPNLPEKNAVIVFLIQVTFKIII